jgi:hypothetical protein
MNASIFPIDRYLNEDQNSPPFPDSGECIDPGSPAGPCISSAAVLK